MEVNTNRRVPVTERSQVSAARLEARSLTIQLGFSEEDTYRTGLVVTELATNLVKHTTAGGELLLRAIDGDPPAQIELLAVDRGPGIVDLGRALRDGVSSGTSPGTGLGAIQRLADTFDIHSSPAGTAIFARVRAGRHPGAASAFEIGAVSVPMQGELVCGDLWRGTATGDELTVVVADGLGHGPSAYEAALAVLQSFDSALEPRAAVERVHAAVRHTRGAAGAVAKVARGARTLTFAGLGNVSGLVQGTASRHQMVSINGTLGHHAPTFRAYSYPWSAESLLVMFSDGLGSHWDLTRYPGLTSRHPALVAAVLYRDFSRQRDDVTVVVAKEAA